MKKNGAGTKKSSSGRGAKNPAAVIASRIGKGLLTALLVCIIIVCVVVAAVSLYVMNFVKPYSVSLSESDLKTTSIMYTTDSAGKNSVLAEVSGTENRIWVPLSGTPKNLRNAIISTEDMRFNEHEGVDFRRTVYSFANMIFHFSNKNQGGSTITQQLIKNIEGNINKRSPAVKIREIITAVDVEKRYSKDQILEDYMNIIPLGNSCYGVQAAANLYFGKDVKDLDIAQCALLAGIIQAPESYEPYKHMAAAQTRQRYVLGNMLRQKMITKAEYTAAMSEKITLTPKKNTVRGWFVDQVIRDVTADLMTKNEGWTQQDAENYLYTGGLRIYTTENLTVQATLDSVYTANSDELFKAWDGSKYQSSMCICDYTGKVLGLVGGTGAKTSNMVLNRATMSYRPAGSSFKPICTYALAIDKGVVNWSTLVPDSPSENVNGSQWPKDDEPWTNANMTIDTALTESRNAVAVRVCKQVGVLSCFNFLTQKLGFSESLSKDVDSSGDSDAYSLGLTLGMFSKKSKGASAREMAAAYEIFGNGGVYYSPHTYTSVTDAEGNVVLQSRQTGIQAISSDTSTIMNRMMQNVVKSGTGTGAQLSNCPVAGKTGTTPDNYDRWWVGCTPEYVGAVWTGYDTPRSIGRGDNPAVTIWRNVFEKLEANRDASVDFKYSGNVVQESYDPKTGLLSVNGSATGWYSTTDPAVQSMS